MEALMKTNRTRRGVFALMLSAGACLPMFAHHSFVAQYDPKKPVTLEGTVTKLEWTNPHARFYIDVKDANGAVSNWELELGSPDTLIRYKWRRDTMKVGDAVTVDGYLARDGTKLANAKTVKFSDGRLINAGSSSGLSDTK
jgi:hypothetical protein